MKNWHPVSLCTDYKILSKALANRLKYIMEEVVHKVQSYCVPGRFISDNVSLIRDILDVCSSLDLELGLISLDQEKAFDRVEHPYLWKLLECFGLSPGFIAMIRVLYRDIESVLKINGGLCAPFNVNRGIRQGCALSGMLYTLSIEPMLYKIQSCIEGLILPHCTVNYALSAYANDVVVLIKNQKEIEILKEIVNNFGVISAAKVNWMKTEAIAVGK